MVAVRFPSSPVQYSFRDLVAIRREQMDIILFVTGLSRLYLTGAEQPFAIVPQGFDG